MRVKRFEGFLKDLIEQADSPEITSVQTFEEAGLTDKPVGLRVQFASGATVFMQVVRTSGPGGDDFSQPEYANLTPVPPGG